MHRQKYLIYEDKLQPTGKEALLNISFAAIGSLFIDNHA
jgi:hypothetical protein